MKYIPFVFAAIVLALVIWWNLYQWNTCMNIIKNGWYCIQHIG